MQQPGLLSGNKASSVKPTPLILDKEGRTVDNLGRAIQLSVRQPTLKVNHPPCMRGSYKLCDIKSFSLEIMQWSNNSYYSFMRILKLKMVSILLLPPPPHTHTPLTPHRQTSVLSRGPRSVRSQRRRRVWKKWSVWRGRLLMDEWDRAWRGEPRNNSPSMNQVRGLCLV